MPLWIRFTMCIRFWCVEMQYLVSLIIEIVNSIILIFHFVWLGVTLHSIRFHLHTNRRVSKVGHLLQIHFQHFIYMINNVISVHIVPCPIIIIHESGEKWKPFRFIQFKMFTVKTLSVSSDIRLIINYGHLVEFTKMVFFLFICLREFKGQKEKTQRHTER